MGRKLTEPTPSVACLDKGGGISGGNLLRNIQWVVIHQVNRADRVHACQTLLPPMGGNVLNKLIQSSLFLVKTEPFLNLATGAHTQTRLLPHHDKGVIGTTWLPMGCMHFHCQRA